MCRIRHIEIDEIAGPDFARIDSNPFGEIAMRIDQDKPTAGIDVATRKRFQESRLASAGLADRVDMRKPVVLLDAERPPVVPEVRLREIRDVG